MLRLVVGIGLLATIMPSSASAGRVVGLKITSTDVDLSDRTIEFDITLNTSQASYSGMTPWGNTAWRTLGPSWFRYYVVQPTTTRTIRVSTGSGYETIPVLAYLTWYWATSTRVLSLMPDGRPKETPDYLKALEYGDGDELGRTSLMFTSSNETKSTYKASFSHTYLDPGTYRVRAKGLVPPDCMASELSTGNRYYLTAGPVLLTHYNWFYSYYFTTYSGNTGSVWASSSWASTLNGQASPVFAGISATAQFTVCGALSDGTACDDFDICTTNDQCDAGGLCTGQLVDCSAWDDDCNVGVCSSLSGECGAQPANQGLGCDDDSACTSGDTCQEGVCFGTYDCDDSDPCTTDTCDDLLGCDNAAIADQGACIDGDLCTVGSVCVSGTCQDGQPKDCSGEDGMCTAGVCNAETGDCEAQPANQGDACDDGQRCTEGTTCQEGVCTGGTTVDCSAASAPCADGVCDPVTGLCRARPINEGQPCDDQSACTEGDHCYAAACVGTPVTCASDNPCLAVSCDPALGCQSTSVADGTSCDDGDACTEGGTCAGGDCLEGAPIDCSGLDTPCARGQCFPDTGTCEVVQLGDMTLCDDGDPCTVSDYCVAGECAGEPRSCADLDNRCNLGVCDPTSGECVTEPREGVKNCPKKSGCACGTLPASPWLVLVGVLILRRRQRR